MTDLLASPIGPRHDLGDPVLACTVVRYGGEIRFAGVIGEGGWESNGGYLLDTIQGLALLGARAELLTVMIPRAVAEARAELDHVERLLGS